MYIFLHLYTHDDGADAQRWIWRCAVYYVAGGRHHKPTLFWRILDSLTTTMGVFDPNNLHTTNLTVNYTLNNFFLNGCHRLFQRLLCDDKWPILSGQNNGNMNNFQLFPLWVTSDFIKSQVWKESNVRKVVAFTLSDHVRKVLTFWTSRIDRKSFIRVTWIWSRLLHTVKPRSSAGKCNSYLGYLRSSLRSHSSSFPTKSRFAHKKT